MAPVWKEVQVAVQSGSTDKLKRVYEIHNLDYGYCPDKAWNVLHYSAYFGKLQIVQYLVGEALVDTNSKTADGWTALYLASAFGHTETVRYLLKNGAETSGCSDSLREGAVHVAARGNNTETLRCLAECGADINLANKFSSTPLHAAARLGQTPAVKCLIEELDADVDVVDEFGRTPLYLAVLDAQVDTVRYFFELGRKQGPKVVRQYYEDAHKAFTAGDFTHGDMGAFEEELDVLLMEVSNEIYRDKNK